MNTTEINKNILKLLKKDDKTLDSLLAGYENEIKAAYRKALKELRAEVADLYARYGDDIRLKDLKLKRLTEKIKAITKAAGIESKEITKEAITELFETAYTKTGESINKALPEVIDIKFNGLNQDSVKAAIFNPADKIKWSSRLTEHISDLTNKVKQEVTQGIIQGKGYVKIAQGIQDRCEISAYKALRIARTETHRVTSTARQIAFERTEQAAETLNLKVRKVWISAIDNRTRDSHLTMNGKLADQQGYYTLPSGVRTLGPGLSGIPEEDINCRCTEGVEIEGL